MRAVPAGGVRIKEFSGSFSLPENSFCVKKNIRNVFLTISQGCAIIKISMQIMNNLNFPHGMMWYAIIFLMSHDLENDFCTLSTGNVRGLCLKIVLSPYGFRKI